MHKNVGSLDRLIRLLIGTILFSLAFFLNLSPGWKALFIVLATSELLTAISGY